MPSLDQSSKVLLVGFDSNFVYSDLIFNTTFITDLRFLAPTGRAVASVNGSDIILKNGDTSVFAIGDYVGFSGNVDNNAYEIENINTFSNKITLSSDVSTKLVGKYVYASKDLTGATFTLNLKLYTAEVEELDGTISIKDLKVRPNPIKKLDLSQYIYIADASIGWAKISLPANTFTESVYPGFAYSNKPAIYCGNIGITLPTPAGKNPLLFPIELKRQRCAFLVFPNYGE